MLLWVTKYTIRGLADQTVFFTIKVIISSGCLWALLIQPGYGVCLSYSEHHFWISFQTPDGQQVFTLTCWQVGRWSAARLIAMIFPAGLVRRPHWTAVSLALFHCPGAGLPFTFHQCLTPTHLLQEAFFNILWLYPGLFLLPGGGDDYKIGNVTFTNKVVKSLESGEKIKWDRSSKSAKTPRSKTKRQGTGDTPWTWWSRFFRSQLLAGSLIYLINHSVTQLTHQLNMRNEVGNMETKESQG